MSTDPVVLLARRSHVHLDNTVRLGTSMLASTPPDELEPGLAPLRDDLELDLGYRLLVADI
jgi:hypothetical protein